MYRLLVPTIALAVSSACIVYDEDVYYEGEADRGEQGVVSEADTDRATDPLAGDEEEEDSAPSLFFDPPAAGLGDIVIVSLWSDDEDVSSFDIKQVEFFGATDVAVLTSTVRGPAELLITLQVDDAGYPEDLDVLVELSDGTVVFLQGAFEVTPGGAGADGPAAPGSGQDDASDGSDDEECTCP
jgi:hypothetical protein